MHTVALKTDGEAWAWGSDGNAQLGIGSGEGIRTAPVRIMTGAADENGGADDNMMIIIALAAVAAIAAAAAVYIFVIRPKR